jgi:hypothetical protein
VLKIRLYCKIPVKTSSSQKTGKIPAETAISESESQQELHQQQNKEQKILVQDRIVTEVIGALYIQPKAVISARKITKKKERRRERPHNHPTSQNFQ